MQEAEVPKVNNGNLANKRRDNTKRTSSIVDFKRNTLDRLDSLKSSRNKHNIVAKKKEFIDLWLKVEQKQKPNRKELGKNKLAINSVHIRSARQRRKW